MWCPVDADKRMSRSDNGGQERGGRERWSVWRTSWIRRQKAERRSGDGRRRMEQTSGGAEDREENRGQKAKDGVRSLESLLVKQKLLN